MPELPEVETIRRDLAVLVGATVSDLRVSDTRLASPAEAARWRSVVVGERWLAATRVGKYLQAQLSNQHQIVFHLRMTGQLVLDDNPGVGRLRFTLDFADGRRLSLYDQRRFAEVRVCAPGELRLARVALGPDALGALTAEALSALMSGRTTRIHALLLDQSRIAGIGNIYAQEALFRAGIRPSRPAGRIPREKRRALWAAIQDVLNEAIARRGTSSRNYRDASGRAGEAQTLHRVYRKSSHPCQRCGTALSSDRVAGRGVTFCRQCQR